MSNNNVNSTGFGKNVFWESHFFSPLRRELLDGKNSQILSQITPLKGMLDYIIYYYNFKILKIFIDITNEVKRPLNNPFVPSSKRILLVSPETPKIPEISFDPQLQSSKKLDFDFSDSFEKTKTESLVSISNETSAASIETTERVRSEKSLASLCERFLDLHGRIQASPIQIQLEDCATKLGNKN